MYRIRGDYKTSQFILYDVIYVKILQNTNNLPQKTKSWFPRNGEGDWTNRGEVREGPQTFTSNTFILNCGDSFTGVCTDQKTSHSFTYMLTSARQLSQ